MSLKNNFELSVITTCFQQNNFVSVYFASFDFKSYNILIISRLVVVNSGKTSALSTINTKGFKNSRVQVTQSEALALNAKKLPRVKSLAKVIQTLFRD
ncbi:MAG: hypothetical protein J7M06_00555 [Proteobacteria bacterium]|nr:hypothetical protein [Pseudomonadota bacterium]